MGAGRGASHQHRDRMGRPGCGRVPDPDQQRTRQLRRLHDDDRGRQHRELPSQRSGHRRSHRRGYPCGLDHQRHHDGHRARRRCDDGRRWFGRRRRVHPSDRIGPRRRLGPDAPDVDAADELLPDLQGGIRLTGTALAVQTNTEDERARSMLAMRGSRSPAPPTSA